MSLVAKTGGCQCGRVRFAARVDPAEAYLCHCRMCQKATGGFAASFVSVIFADVEWSGEPDWYASSPIAERPFCSRCGTPLGFAFPDGDKIDLTVGSFDDPGRFRPVHHFGVEHLHEAWIDTSALPRYRADEDKGTIDRWMEKVGKLPD